jgi:hypothetical protein
MTGKPLVTCSRTRTHTSQGGLMQYFDTHTHAISADTETYPVKPLGGTRSEMVPDPRGRRRWPDPQP